MTSAGQEGQEARQQLEHDKNAKVGPGKLELVDKHRQLQHEAKGLRLQLASKQVNT